MAVVASAALLAELDAIDGRPPERWVEILQQVTDLFVADADRLHEQQIGVFDDVIVRLMDRVGVPALIQLGKALSEVKRAPPKAIHRLAFDGDILIAGPVLKRCRCIPQADLVEIARVQHQAHLRAIACRPSIDPQLSEPVVQHGDAAVHHALAGNLGARFSESGWAWLVEAAERDASLAEKLRKRSDAPPGLRRKVQAKVDDARMRHLLAMPQAVREKIETTVATTEAPAEFRQPGPPDYVEAHARMVDLNRKGKLNDSSINRFAVCREYANVVAALAFLSGSSIEVIEPLIFSDQLEGLIVTCKAARLNWATTTMIVRNRPGCPPVSHEELERVRATFDVFSLSVAQRTVRF